MLNIYKKQGMLTDTLMTNIESLLNNDHESERFSKELTNFRRLSTSCEGPAVQMITQMDQMLSRKLKYLIQNH